MAADGHEQIRAFVVYVEHLEKTIARCHVAGSCPVGVSLHAHLFMENYACKILHI